jgi:hypothetical protein
MTEINDNENLKIGIFMWFDDNIKEYASINYAINQIYCDKYGYTLIKSNIRNCPKRKPHWERIPLLLDNFDNFDYLIWIDSDAHFYIDGPPILNVINNHLDKSFIFSGDTDISENKNITCEINSGFFIVKNCEFSKEVLNKWLHDEDLFKSPKLSNSIFGTNKWNDQGVLRIMYSENILDLCNKSIIIDYAILQHFNKTDSLEEKIYGLEDKPFVYHCTNGKNIDFNIRVKKSKEYYESYKNSFIKKFNQFINPNIQISKKVIADILMNCENKKMLVFGLGYDSDLWYNSTNKNTFFVEDNPKYIALNKNIDANNIIYYQYKGINVKNSLKLTEEQIDGIKPPEEIIALAPFDIILIDGPTGFDDGCPGRLLPIFWSKKYLSKQGTLVYVDDASRNLEKKCINKYWLNNTKLYFKDRLGSMKISV